ncbi:MAG TPA: nitronate monooxygenase, partial [Vicinamibacterales bacterium]
LEHPIVQAPIGSATTPALVAAVCHAGALGSLSITWRSPEEIAAVLAATRTLTSRPFAINVVLAWPQDERIAIALEAGVRLVWTFWGDPSGHAVHVHEAGGLLIHTIGSVEDAARAVDGGVDVLVAQGIEAGGHVCGTTPARALLSAVSERFPDVPVIVAGGMADADDVATMMEAGADAVCLGTRFICAAEANAAPIYQRLIIEAGADATAVGEIFNQGWPHAPHRVLRNSTVRLWEEAGRPASGTRPGQGERLATMADGRAIERYGFAMPRADMQGNLEALALYAGEGAARIRDVLPAADIVRALARKLPAAAGA